MKEALRLCLISLPRKTVRDAEFSGYFVPRAPLSASARSLPTIWKSSGRKPDPERFTKHAGKTKSILMPGCRLAVLKCIGLHFAETGQSDTPSSITELSLERADREMPLDTTSHPCLRTACQSR